MNNSAPMLLSHVYESRHKSMWLHKGGVLEWGDVQIKYQICVDTFSSKQSGWHFTDDTFFLIFVNELYSDSSFIEFVPMTQIGINR